MLPTEVGSEACVWLQRVGRDEFLEMTPRHPLQLAKKEVQHITVPHPTQALHHDHCLPNVTQVIQDTLHLQPLLAESDARSLTFLNTARFLSVLLDRSFTSLRLGEKRR